jgi:hypothetical protein
MSRGYLAVWYRGYGIDQPAPNPQTPENYRRMVLGVLRAWRYHHPVAPMVFLDMDGQLTREDKAHLFGDLAIVDGWQHYGGLRPAVETWPRNFMAKVYALRASPFEQTCLFDLDLLALGNVSDVWELTTGQIGVLGYPRYRMTTNRICSALMVVKDPSLWRPFFAAAEIVAADKPGRSYDDEAPLDLCMSAGSIAVTKLPHWYGMDPTALLNPNPHKGPWCDCDEPLAVDWDIHPPMWWMGKERVFALHLSGACRQAIVHPLWLQYHERIAASLGKYP